MKTLTFKELPQLQTFIFADEGGPGTPDLGRFGYCGVMVAVKLNDRQLIGLTELFSDKKDSDGKEKKQPVSVKPKDMQAEVIAVDVGIPQNKFHEIIARAELVQFLINLDRPV